MTSGKNALWRAVRPWVFPLVLLGCYEAYARRAAALGSDALAPPTAALKALAGAAMDGSLWQATGFTLGTAALGLLVGAGLGTLLGIVLGLSQRAAGVSFLTVEVFRPVPSVALIPLAMLMFGFGLRMELAIVAFATFWPLLLLVQAAVRAMAGGPGGAIINISSVNAIRGYRGTSVYGAAKAGLEALTRSLARELGPMRIRVNCVSPGFFASQLTAEVGDAHRERILRHTPLGRLATVDDIADAVLFLASEKASFITGQTLVVDGGITC